MMRLSGGSRSKGDKEPAKKTGSERRIHHRHDLEPQDIFVDRWDGGRRSGHKFGKIVDLSAGGVRIVTCEGDVKPDHQIRVRLALPSYAGICPFISNAGSNLEPKNEWVGWMTVNRVVKLTSEQFEVAGRLVDMDEVDRGMLGLYLSTQPIAA
ncbi:MAG: hypothetical protein ABSF29_02570 [Tepidisphaeraceae bacterium]|jgi:hypothetical protein